MTIDRAALQAEMTAWRRDLHAHPECGFEERRTSDFVAQKLRDFGLDEVAQGVGGTGVVGTLRRGGSNRSVALRADMDALRIAEQGEGPYHFSARQPYEPRRGRRRPQLSRGAEYPEQGDEKPST